jgi:hypothetical protein
MAGWSASTDLDGENKEGKGGSGAAMTTFIDGERRWGHVCPMPAPCMTGAGGQQQVARRPSISGAVDG